MKAALGAIGAAAAASACCIGPVAFSLVGVGAFGAYAVQLEPYRPWFIAATVGSLALAFYGAYRHVPHPRCSDTPCAPRSRRPARIIVWCAFGLVAALLAFPYYIGWLV